MSAALVIQEPQQTLSIVRNAQTIKAQHDAILDLMRSVMVDGIDYGKIPGAKKPSLLKPGSEKLLSMFHLGVRPRVRELSTPDTIRYQVHAEIYEIGSGRVVGVGLGEASSAESKYQWREAVCDAEFNEASEDRRRMKWKKGGGGNFYQAKQVREEMEDKANTVLKMAKKRAQIDGTLTATGASAIFGQDIEDLGDAPPVLLQPTGNAGVPTGSASAERPTLQKKPEVPQSSSSPRPGVTCITEAQARRFYSICREAKRIKPDGKYKDEVRGYLLENVGVEDDRKIPAEPKSIYEKACAWAAGGQ